MSNIDNEKINTQNNSVKSTGKKKNGTGNKTGRENILKTRNLLKHAGLFILILIFMISLTACSINAKNESTVKETNKTENAEYPLKIKDAKGFEVEIKEKPNKIVSLTLTTDEILLSLIDKSRIAALSHLSEDPGLSNVTEEAKEIPVKAKLEIETLVAMQPDLIIVSDWTDEKAVQQLRDANIAVYALATSDTIDEVKESIVTIARIVDEEEKGQELISWMDEKLKNVEEKIKTLKDEEKVRVLSCDSFFYTYGKGTTFDDIAKHAGVINIASEQGLEMWQEISKEKIIEWNPDVIFLPSWSYEGFDAEKFTEEFKNDKSLAVVNAIKNNRVYNIPDAHMMTTSQYIVLAVEDVAKAAYPQLFDK